VRKGYHRNFIVYTSLPCHFPARSRRIVLVRAALTAAGTVTECCIEIAVNINTKLRRMSANQVFWICDIYASAPLPIDPCTAQPCRSCFSSWVRRWTSTCDTAGDQGGTGPSFHLYIISPATLSRPLPEPFLFIIFC
jgi:hypothetical protein